MGILERVGELKQRGVNDYEIIQDLREQGFSPLEINEALSQASVKSMVATEQVPFSYAPNEEFRGMQPSMMASPEPPSPDMQYPPQQMQEYPQNQEQYPEYQPQEYSQEPQYSQYQMPEYHPAYGMDMETISDIAEQIIEEKTNEMKKQMSAFTRFKEELQLEVQRIEERLTKIENVFNEMQVAILRKIGDYGQDIKDIASEMHQTQESFSKIINPLTHNMRELKKISGEDKGKKKSKRGAGFEDYLR